MKLLTLENTQLSEVDQEKTENPTETSNSGNSQDGDSDNTTDTQDSSNILADINEELANILTEYANIGGEVSGITLPLGSEVFGTRFLIILPADRTKNGIYSLREVDHNPDNGKHAQSKENQKEHQDKALVAHAA